MCELRPSGERKNLLNYQEDLQEKEGLLKELTAIREVGVIYPQGTLAHPKDHITLSRMTPLQKKLAECLEIADTLGG